METHEPKPPNPLIESWLAWLTPLHTTLFITITSETRTHPEALRKRWIWVFQKTMRKTFGNQWRHHPDLPMWIYGMERHASWNPHAHIAMIFPPDTKVTDVLHLKSFQDALTRSGGFSKVEISHNPEHVKAYVLKYCIKGGDLELSANFNPKGHRQCQIDTRRKNGPTFSQSMTAPPATAR